MSSSNPAGSPAMAPTIPATAAAPKVPATSHPPVTPKWFMVRKGQDWGKFEGPSEPDAETKFNKHFGITGSAHRAEISTCDKPADGEVWHSGQKVTR